MVLLRSGPHRKFRLFKHACNLLLFGGLFETAAVCAESVKNTADPEPGCSSFSLPPQNLHLSLAEIARRNDLFIAYDPGWAKQLLAPALQGNFCGVHALQALVEQLPVTLKAIGEGWIVKPKPAFLHPAVRKISDENNRIEEVAVFGRFSDIENRAASLKFSSNTQKEIILATDIAKFPAANIAEALNRLPGISVERDRGQAIFISINGLPSDFNQLMFNGAPIATNENARTSEQYGRRFHYHTLPAELIARVDISKTPSAATVAGAIGGNVDMYTHRPLNMDAADNAIKITTNYSELAEKAGTGLTLVNHWVNNNETLGIGFTAAFDRRYVRQDRFFTFDWLSENNSEIRSGTIHYAPAMRPTLEREKRQRTGLVAALQWHATEQHQLDIDLLFLDQKIDYRENTFSADYALTTLDSQSIVWRDNTIVAGRTASGSVQIGSEQAGLSDVTRAININHTWLTNSWRFHTRFSSSNAESATEEPIRRTRFRIDEGVEFSFELPHSYDDGLPQIEYHNINLADASYFPGRRLEWRVIDTKASFNGIQFKAMHDLDGPTQQLGFGVNYFQHKRRYLRQDRLYTESIFGNVYSGDYFTTVDLDFLSASNGGIPQRWLAPKDELLWPRDAFTGSGNATARDRLNSYLIGEAILGVYVQYNFELNKLRGNMGVRGVTEKRTSEGYYLEDEAQITPQAISFNRKNQALLPSLNLAYAATEYWQFRAALSRALSRPGTQYLAPRLTLNSGDSLEAEGGNPMLKSVLAWQLDFSLEYLYRDYSAFTATAFYKKLNNFLQPSGTEININNQNYKLNSYTNGAGAEIIGGNIAFYQYFYPFKNRSKKLGVSANFSYTHSKAEYRQEGFVTRSELEGVAERTFNAQLFYETSPCVVRINYSWTGRVLESVQTPGRAARFKAPFGVVSARASWFVKDTIELFTDVTNVTNSAEKALVLDQAFSEYTLYGRMLSAGVSIKY